MNFPFYSTLVGQVIVGPYDRILNPDTGEVYGGTDYQNPVKLTEIGAKTLRVQAVTEGYEAVAWEVVPDPLGLAEMLRRPTLETLIPPPSEEELEAKSHAEALAALAASDAATIRVIEDLISVLVTKGVIVLADLPLEARSKLSARQEYRDQL